MRWLLNVVRLTLLSTIAGQPGLVDGDIHVITLEWLTPGFSEGERGPVMPGFSNVTNTSCVALNRNDAIAFVWDVSFIENAAHQVDILRDRNAFYDCDFSDVTNLTAATPIGDFTINYTDHLPGERLFYSCGITQHCRTGEQKIEVAVIEDRPVVEWGDMNYAGPTVFQVHTNDAIEFRLTGDHSLNRHTDLNATLEQIASSTSSGGEISVTVTFENSVVNSSEHFSCATIGHAQSIIGEVIEVQIIDGFFECPPVATPTPTFSPTAAPTSQPSPLPTSEPSPSPTSQPSASPTPTSTSSPSPTPTILVDDETASGGVDLLSVLDFSDGFAIFALVFLIAGIIGTIASMRFARTARFRREHGENFHPSHFSIFMVGVAMFDFLGDIAFLFHSRGQNVPFFFGTQTTNTLFFVGLAFLLIASGGNVIIVLWCFRRERSKVITWFERSQAVSTIVVLVALTNVDSIAILWSGVFGLKMFQLPFTEKTQKIITVLGLFQNLVEDIPQVLLQLAFVEHEGFSVTTIISIAGSSLSLSYGILRRVLWIILVAGDAKAFKADGTLNKNRSTRNVEDLEFNFEDDSIPRKPKTSDHLSGDRPVDVEAGSQSSNPATAKSRKRLDVEYSRSTRTPGVASPKSLRSDDAECPPAYQSGPENADATTRDIDMDHTVKSAASSTTRRRREDGSGGGHHSRESSRSRSPRRPRDRDVPPSSLSRSRHSRRGLAAPTVGQKLPPRRTHRTPRQPSSSTRHSRQDREDDGSFSDLSDELDFTRRNRRSRLRPVRVKKRNKRSFSDHDESYLRGGNRSSMHRRHSSVGGNDAFPPVWADDDGYHSDDQNDRQRRISHALSPHSRGLSPSPLGPLGSSVELSSRNVLAREEQPLSSHHSHKSSRSTKSSHSHKSRRSSSINSRRTGHRRLASGRLSRTLASSSRTSEGGSHRHAEIRSLESDTRASGGRRTPLADHSDVEPQSESESDSSRGGAHSADDKGAGVERRRAQRRERRRRERLLSRDDSYIDMPGLEPGAFSTRTFTSSSSRRNNRSSHNMSQTHRTPIAYRHKRRGFDPVTRSNTQRPSGYRVPRTTSLPPNAADTRSRTQRHGHTRPRSGSDLSEISSELDESDHEHESDSLSFNAPSVRQRVNFGLQRQRRRRRDSDSMSDFGDEHESKDAAAATERLSDGVSPNTPSVLPARAVNKRSGEPSKSGEPAKADTVDINNTRVEK